MRGMQFTPQCVSRCTIAAVGVEHFGDETCGIKYACESPDAKWRGKKCVLTAVRVVGTNQ